jgi:hypothetical protein
MGGTVTSGHPRRSQTLSKGRQRRTCPPLPKLLYRPYPRRRGRSAASLWVAGGERAQAARVPGFRSRPAYRNMSLNMRGVARGMRNARRWERVHRGPYRPRGCPGPLSTPQCLVPRATILPPRPRVLPSLSLPSMIIRRTLFTAENWIRINLFHPFHPLSSVLLLRSRI